MVSLCHYPSAPFPATVSARAPRSRATSCDTHRLLVFHSPECRDDARSVARVANEGTSRGYETACSRATTVSCHPSRRSPTTMPLLPGHHEHRDAEDPDDEPPLSVLERLGLDPGVRHVPPVVVHARRAEHQAPPLSFDGRHADRRGRSA